MGLYNRDYYRNSDNSDTWGIEALTPVVKYLILANIAVFLLQIFIVRDDVESRLAAARKQNPMLDEFLTAKESGDREAMEKFRRTYPGLDQGFPDEAFDGILAGTLRPSIIQEWFELDTNKVVYGGQVWRLLTHAFCHDRAFFWHILFNMLCLYWFGPTIESMYGPREFLRFYLLAVVVAGLAFVALDLRTGSTIPGIGASGAVLAVMMLYTMHYPRETIHVFWLVPTEMRWIMLGYLIWTVHPVLLALSGEHVFPGIAHVAHLGGLAFGFMYHHFQWRLENLTDRIGWPRWRWKRRPKLRLVAAQVSRPEPDAEMGRVDELLQKIFELGQDSLTDEERAVLENASARLRNRGRDR